MFFDKRLDKSLTDAVENLENDALYIPQYPFLMHKRKEKLEDIDDDVSRVMNIIHKIYEAYGLDVAKAQKLLILLKKIKESAESMNTKNSSEEFKNFIKTLELILQKEKYLYTMPGKGIKGDYLKLTRLLEKKEVVSNKIRVEIKGSGISRNGVLIQGLKINDEFVEFTAYHFTNENSAKLIYDSNELLVKNIEDPYIYLLEALSFANKTETEIRHMIGSAHATDVILTKIRYPVDKVWIKVEKKRPTHFALEGDVSFDDIIKRKGKYMIHKKISSF